MSDYCLTSGGFLRCMNKAEIFSFFESFFETSILYYIENRKGSVEMEKEIKGIVNQNPISLPPCCLFVVEQEDGFYLVISTDVQAAKDTIFVEQGQEIWINGSGIEGLNLKGILFTEQARINVNRMVALKAD